MVTWDADVPDNRSSLHRKGTSFAPKRAVSQTSSEDEDSRKPATNTATDRSTSSKTATNAENRSVTIDPANVAHDNAVSQSNAKTKLVRKGTQFNKKPAPPPSDSEDEAEEGDVVGSAPKVNASLGPPNAGTGRRKESVCINHGFKDNKLSHKKDRLQRKGTQFAKNPAPPSSDEEEAPGEKEEVDDTCLSFV